MAILEVKNLSFTYPGEDGPALADINLFVESGEFILLCGRSGSGKSTLLRLLKKEIAPFGKLGGEIRMDTRKTGFVGQNVESNLITDTVFGELAFALQNSDMNRSEISLRIAETASYFNLNKYINEKTENLSGGVKQLLALACAASAKPDILLLDEPCSQLDPVSAQNFRNAVLRLNKERGVTVLICEHTCDLLGNADRVVFLENGSASFCGMPADFAGYLADSKKDMALMLPPYTLLLKSRTLDFAAARREILSVKEKSFTEGEPKKFAIKAKGLAFAYQKGAPDVLFGLDYKAESGKINMIVGANGSGKTTLLKCLVGLLKPYGGRVKANGKTVYMPQNVYSLFLCDTVGQEVQSEELLQSFGLETLKNRNPFDLSGGEAQRLALAKAVASGADILLLDEPTKGTDAVFRAQFAQMLRQWCAQGKTVVAATHDLEFAGRYADHAAFLFNGGIAAADTRRRFFASLDVYTTSLSAMSGGRIVSVDDAEAVK